MKDRRGGLAADFFQHGADKGDGVGFGLLADGFGFCAGANGGVGGGEGGESFDGVGQLHRVAFFPFKINEDLSGRETPFGDLTKAPAFVAAVGAGREPGEGGGKFCGEGSGFDGLL